jgi:DNA adenine methylase
MTQNLTYATPLLKWVGGKARLLQPVIEKFPVKFDRYIEPFLGGGAIFFALGKQGSLVSDLNGNLIDFYNAVAESPLEVLDALTAVETQFNSLKVDARKEWHASLRHEFNESSQDQITKAASFLALNKTSFNGLYRENSSGRFNVPFNAMKGPLKLFERANFLKAAKLLKDSERLNESFESTVERANSGDLVYFDPPYVPLSPTSAFTAYNKAGFGEREQRELIEVSLKLAQRGVSVVLSNSFSTWVLENYSNDKFNIHSVEVMRGVSAKSSSRGVIREALIVSR